MTDEKSFYDRMMEAYSAAIKVSGEKKAEYERELEELFNDREQENRLLGVIDVCTRRAKDSLFDEDSEAAAGYQGRADEAQLQLDARHERIKYLSFEINRLDGELIQIARKVLQDSYPGIKAAVHQSWVDAFDFADQAWEDLQVFGGKIGIEVSRRYRNGFAFFDYDDTRELYRRLKPWIGTPIN
jgi:hypothetical protein